MQPGYETQPETQAPEQGRERADRWSEVEVLEAYQQSQQQDISLLSFARERGIPEATLRHWVSRAEATEAPAALSAFIESREGLAVLHRIVLAAIFVLTQVVGGGVRSVCTFLRLSGLWRVVAAGYGTQQQAVKQMELAIVAFGDQERRRLAQAMTPMSITVAQDETFHHGRICLVGIEPVSNYILVEQYAEDRGAQSWDAAMARGLSGLPVEVFQSTSDEASALLRHARTTLGAHHSPDLFHPQQDISRATSLPLGRQAEAAEQAAAEAADEVDRLCDEAEQYAQQRQGAGRPRDYDGRLDRANNDYEQAQADAVEATERRSRVRQAARGISRAYHPFDLETGQPRQAQQVEADLTEQFGRIEQVADEAGLSDRCRKRLRKAKKLLPQMVATVALVHTLIRDKLQALDLVHELLRAAQDLLVPMHYLKLRLGKAGSAKERAELLGAIARLQDKIDGPGGALADIEVPLRSLLDRTAQRCAELFQRSSSNVEGRNGVLALRHHCIHLLSQRKLAALTVLHNFGTTRPDGTTAAQRFFGQPHRDLFEHLMLSLPPPKRPAAPRRATN